MKRGVNSKICKGKIASPRGGKRRKKGQMKRQKVQKQILLNGTGNKHSG